MADTDVVQQASYDGRTRELVTERGVRRLRRSRRGRVVAGVCGGVGEHLGIDPVLVRLVAIALTVTGGAGVLTYLIAWALIPDADQADAPVPEPVVGRRVSAALGVGVVAFSVVLLLGPQSLWIDAAVVWPLAAVALVAVYVTTKR